jgi:uncharacterized protein YegP (UPF0339 family)
MRFEVYQDRSRQWRWSLYAESGRIAESAGGYHDSEECRHAIALVTTSSLAPIQSPVELLAEYLGIPIQQNSL